MKRIIMRLVLPLVAAIGFIAVAAACGGGGDDKKTGDSSGSGVQEFTVKMTDLVTFDPPQITVEARKLVRLAVDNRESASPHDFTISVIPVSGVRSEGGEAAGGHGGHMQENALHMALEGKTSGVLEFTPTEPGEYEFVCTVIGHAEAGMRGKLVVT